MYSDSVYHMLLPQFIMYYSSMHYILYPPSHDLKIQSSHHQPQRRCQPRNLNQPRNICTWSRICHSGGRARNHSAIAARRAIPIYTSRTIQPPNQAGRIRILYKRFQQTSHIWRGMALKWRIVINSENRDGGLAACAQDRGFSW